MEAKLEYGYVKNAMRHITNMSALVGMGIINSAGLSLKRQNKPDSQTIEYDDARQIAYRLRETEALHEFKLKEPANPRVQIPTDEDLASVQDRKKKLVPAHKKMLDDMFERYFSQHPLWEEQLKEQIEEKGMTEKEAKNYRIGCGKTAFFQWLKIEDEIVDRFISETVFSSVPRTLEEIEK